MLESALEQLLLRFLAPYVDGISGDKLRVGVLRGSLELHALSVKAEAPSLLGLEGLRVRSGGIGRIQLKIPWNKLHTGKLRAVVEKVHLELEPIAEALARNSDGNLEAKLMQELRDAKSRAVEMRVEQMRDLIKQQSEDRLEGGNNYFVRLLRKILNNIHVDLSDLCIAFVTTSTPALALGLELSSLEVVSTDQTFRECLEEVNVSGQSLYKLLHLKGLALLVSPDQPSLLGAGYALSPSSVRLKLSHVPSDQTLRLQFEVATQEVTKVNFQRSQVVQILALRSAVAEEVARLYRLMVPLEQENEILQDVAGASEEYAKLFEEVVVKSPDGDLKEDSEKLQQLEDTLSVRLLARQRLLVYNKVDQLRELARRRQPEVENAGRVSVVPAISDKELQDMLREQDSKAEAVDLPQRLQFDLRLGKVSVNLVDDQSSDQALQQLLCWELHEANCVVHIHFVTDHRPKGRDAAEWRVEGKFADLQENASAISDQIQALKRKTEETERSLKIKLQQEEITERAKTAETLRNYQQQHATAAAQEMEMMAQAHLQAQRHQMEQQHKKYGSTQTRLATEIKELQTEASKAVHDSSSDLELVNKAISRVRASEAVKVAKVNQQMTVLMKSAAELKKKFLETDSKVDQVISAEASAAERMKQMKLMVDEKETTYEATKRRVEQIYEELRAGGKQKAEVKRLKRALQAAKKHQEQAVSLLSEKLKDVYRQVDTEKAKMSQAQNDSHEAARQSLEDWQAEFDSLQAPDLSPQDDSVAAVLREVEASSKA